MKPNLFMMPWYPRDFLAATLGWPIIERAVYRELLDSQWEQGGLPDDDEALRAIVRCTTEEWRNGWSPRVQQKFPIGGDGLRRNPRLEDHRSKAIALAMKRSEIGRTGGRKSASRRAAQRQANGEPIAS